jgi:hypothetical protein
MSYEALLTELHGAVGSIHLTSAGTQRVVRLPDSRAGRALSSFIATGVTVKYRKDLGSAPIFADGSVPQFQEGRSPPRTSQ